MPEIKVVVHPGCCLLRSSFASWAGRLGAGASRARLAIIRLPKWQTDGRRRKEEKGGRKENCFSCAGNGGAEKLNWAIFGGGGRRRRRRQWGKKLREWSWLAEMRESWSTTSSWKREGKKLPKLEKIEMNSLPKLHCTSPWSCLVGVHCNFAN